MQLSTFLSLRYKNEFQTLFVNLSEWVSFSKVKYVICRTNRIITCFLLYLNLNYLHKVIVFVQLQHLYNLRSLKMLVDLLSNRDNLLMQLNHDLLILLDHILIEICKHIRLMCTYLQLRQEY